MTVQARLIEGVLAKFDGNQRKASAALGISHQGFNHYVRGIRTAENDAIAAMADLLGENATKAVAQHIAETAKTDRVRELFSQLAKVACAVLFLSATTNHAQAASAISWADKPADCILCPRRFIQMLHRVIAFARISCLKLYRITSVSNTSPCLLA